MGGFAWERVGLGFWVCNLLVFGACSRIRVIFALHIFHVQFLPYNMHLYVCLQNE
jgi:hypothetical protein